MKNIIVTSQKGGSGKTTLSRNLAVAASEAGRRVLLIDLDPQQSLRAWWSGRSGDMPAMLSADPRPSHLRSTLEQASPHFDLAIIDTPPAAAAWLSDVLPLTDLALIPVRPSPDDLRAVGSTIANLRSARTPFAFVLSQVAPRARLTSEAIRALASHGRVAPTNLGARVVYAESAGTGLGVTESTDARAADEMHALHAYVEEIL